jgi:hypothetical protein
MKTYLSKAGPTVFAIYGLVASFFTYTCMYAFRKPVTICLFDTEKWLDIDFKIWVVTSQVIGYALSKFIGIKFISELTPNVRAFGILFLIGVSAIGLFFFAILPTPFNLIFMVVNGLPLGMIWGLVFNYLEGRQMTELLATGLSVTQIFSTGIVKTIGMWTIMSFGITERWMPVVTGGLFILPLCFFVWMLNQIPPPSHKDILLRTKREPMDSKARWKFFNTFAPGLVLLIAIYAILTTYRDFRDNFTANIWNSLGYRDNSLIFTITEIPAFIGVLLLVGFMIRVKNNFLAFVINHYSVIIGSILIGVSTYLFQFKFIGPEFWMTLIGFGLYIGYVPFSIMLFERMISAFKYIGTVGFIMYVSDSFGYLGSVMILFYKNFSHSDLSWLSFFMKLSYFMSIICIILAFVSLIYFIKKHKSYHSNKLSKDGI